MVLFCTLTGVAQKRWRTEYQNLLIVKSTDAIYPSKEAAMSNVKTVYSKLLSAGYLDAVLDTIVKDSTIKVNVRAGSPYVIGSILWEQDSTGVIMQQAQIWKKPKKFDTGLIAMRATNLLHFYENRGYPFVSISLSEIKLVDQKADLTYKLDRGPLILMDSIIFRSESKIPEKYVRKYLDIRKGEAYNESKMVGVQKKLKEIPFVRLRQSPEVRFTPGKADLFVFLEKKKANFFNGILGIRPDDVTGKVNFTGDVEIKLNNAFNGGEEFYLNWRKMQALTQDLSSKLMLPYLFNTPIGIDGQLKIYKRDSTFTSIKTAAGILFNFGGQNRLRAFVEKNTTNQISTFITAQPLANVNSTFYGLSIQLEKLDYRYNPRKGYLLQAEGATGIRNIASSNLFSENNPLPAVKKNVHRIDVQADYYIPTWKKQSIRLHGAGAGLFAPSIFDNEMFRIGGLRTLRGINEESINTTSYAIGTLEYRFLFEENSALYVFVDQSWYEKKSATTFLTDTPIGFGAGVNFETKAGIFTFNYALGQQYDNPILVRNAKVSFGFRNIF